MISIEHHIPLAPYTTFGVSAFADSFCRVTSVAEIRELVAQGWFTKRFLILGGGSNLLFLGDFHGLVVRNELLGQRVVHETEENIVIEVGSGVNWHSFVMQCIDHDRGGVENLSLIPGTMGAAPMQNIGAYGVEVKEVIEEVKGIDLSTGREVTFTNKECQFSYRESVFKNACKEKFFISSVTLRLTKKNHVLRTHYGAIQNILDQQKITSPTLRHVSDAVIYIRSSKLPDPKQIGNAGSFFKNPSITVAQFEQLRERYPEIPSYPSENQLIKVPAGWLIEQCGWKGKRVGRAGVHHQQALVLVNHGQATGAELFSLAKEIQRDVREKFSIDIAAEVNIIESAS